MTAAGETRCAVCIACEFHETDTPLVAQLVAAAHERVTDHLTIVAHPLGCHRCMRARLGRT